MRQQISSIIVGVIFVVFCGYILSQSESRMVNQLAVNTFFPSLSYFNHNNQEFNMSEIVLKQLFPLYEYIKKNTSGTAKIEDSLTYEMLLARQEMDEETVSEDLVEQAVEKEPVVTANADLAIERLRDVNYLLSKFYTVDRTTQIYERQLNVDDLLNRNMKINQKSNGPKVLIFHTHSQEAFSDSKTGEVNDTIVGVGTHLAARLNEMGIETLHHTGVYDLINGKLDRSKAYQQAEVGVKEILNQYPSIEVIIDLHRDGVPETTHLVTEIEGKQVAKIMFFNGLCRTKSNGDLTSMPNPYIQENLALSLQMQLEAEKLYSGLTRRIYLKGYRYNMHLMPKSLLVEAGAQTNTVEEVKNAMNLLAKILSEVLL